MPEPCTCGRRIYLPGKNLVEDGICDGGCPRYDRTDETQARSLAGNRGGPWMGIRAGDRKPAPPPRYPPPTTIDDGSYCPVCMVVVALLAMALLIFAGFACGRAC